MIKILLILLLCFPVVSWTDDIDHDEALRLKQSGEILPFETILKKAKQHHDGKVLEIELEKKHGRYIYEIEILDSEGILWEMKINAADGNVVSEEVED